MHEILGKVAQDRGYKRVYVMVPNYQAGKDSAAGFKLDYKGEIVEEIYMPLGTLDFQVELSKIASLKPDARLHLHARRHGRQPGEAIQAGRACRQDPGAVGLHRR